MLARKIVSMKTLYQKNSSKIFVTTASRLSYELGINGEQKSQWKLGYFNKNGHSTFHTGKPGNFNSLREG